MAKGTKTYFDMGSAKTKEALPEYWFKGNSIKSDPNAPKSQIYYGGMNAGKSYYPSQSMIKTLLENGFKSSDEMINKAIFGTVGAIEPSTVSFWNDHPSSAPDNLPLIEYLLDH